MQPPQFSFLTIQSPTEGLFKEKGSRFISFAYPESNDLQVKEYLEALKKKYYDARHHCFACVLGADGLRYRAVDAGEPGHSAGDPILGRIRSAGLTNVLIVVVRYFGGVKLGVGGLIKAYRSAADEALKQAIVIETEITERFKIAYDFNVSSETMKLLKDFDLKMISQEFDEHARIEVDVRLRDKDKFLERTAHLQAIHVKIEVQSIE